MSTPQESLVQNPQTPPPVVPATPEPQSMTLRDYIDTAGESIGVPKSLRDAIFDRESGFEHYEAPGVVKRGRYKDGRPSGALGIGQLMPGTANRLGVDINDPIQNAYGSLKEQKRLYDKYLAAQGDPTQAALLTAAAYDAGEGAVEKHGGIPPYPETQAYVSHVAKRLKQSPIIDSSPENIAAAERDVAEKGAAVQRAGSAYQNAKPSLTTTISPSATLPDQPLPQDRANRQSQIMMLPGRGYQEIPYDPNHPDEGPTQTRRRLEMNAINQGTQGDLLQHAAAIRDEFGDPTGAQMPVSAATKTPLYGQGYGAEYTKSPLDPGYGDAPAAQPNDMEFGGMSPAEKAAMATAQAQPNAIDNFSRIAMAKMAEQRQLAARRAQLQAKVAQARAVMAKKQGQGTMGEGLNTPSPDAMGSGLSSAPAGGNLRQLDDPEAARIIRLQNQVASEQSPDEKATGMAPGTANARLFDPKLTANEEALRRAAIEKGQEQQQADLARLAPRIRSEVLSRDYARKNGYLRILDQLANRSLSEVSQVMANAPELVPSLKIAETLGPKGFTDAIQGAQSYLRDYSKVQAAASNYEPPNVTGGQQATKVLANMGFDVAKLAAAVAITKLPLSSVMVGESIALNADKPAQEQIEAASKAYLVGRALEVLPEAAQKGLAKAPGIGKIIDAHPEAAARTIAGVGFGAMSGTGEALAGGTKAQVIGATLGGGLTGAVLAGGGPKEIARGAMEYTVRSPLTPESVKDVVANVMDYGKGLVKSEDGRNLSLYVDKETGKVFGNELTPDEAKSYDPSIVTGEKRPVRNAKTVSGDEYDQLARALNIETKTPAKQVEAGVPADAAPEKNITPKEIKTDVETRRPAESSLQPVQRNQLPNERLPIAGDGSPVSAASPDQNVARVPGAGLERSIQEGAGAHPEPVRHVDLQVRDEEGKFDKETAAQAEARRAQVSQSVTPELQTEPRTPNEPATSTPEQPPMTGAAPVVTSTPEVSVPQRAGSEVAPMPENRVGERRAIEGEPPLSTTVVAQQGALIAERQKVAEQLSRLKDTASERKGLAKEAQELRTQSSSSDDPARQLFAEGRRLGQEQGDILRKISARENAAIKDAIKADVTIKSPAAVQFMKEHSELQRLNVEDPNSKHPLIDALRQNVKRQKDVNSQLHSMGYDLKAGTRDDPGWKLIRATDRSLVDLDASKSRPAQRRLAEIESKLKELDTRDRQRESAGNRAADIDRELSTLNTRGAERRATDRRAQSQPEGKPEPKSMNFTQFANSRGLASDYNVIDHSDLSPSGSVSNRARKAAQGRQADRAAQNQQAHQEFEDAIRRGEIIDAEPSNYRRVTREKLEARDKAARDKELQSQLSNIDSQIRTIENLGPMSHLPNGKLKAKYQRTVDIYNQRKADLLSPKVETAPQIESLPLGGVEPQTQGEPNVDISIRGSNERAAKLSLPEAVTGSLVAAPVEVAKAETSPAIQQAFQDWHERRAYIDGNGNYHVKGERKSGGPIAPWNKEVKRAFTNVSEFHRAVEGHFAALSVARPADVPPPISEGQIGADSKGTKQRSLPKTFKAAEMETGKNLHYAPESIKDDGVTLGKQLVADKGVDGAIEFVKTGDGIEWASTGYEVLSKLRQEEADLRQSNPKAADLVQEKRLKFLDGFVEGATERGRSIVGIKAIEEFAPDRAVYLLNKASQKKRGRGISAEEDARMAALGQELERERDRSKNLEAALAEATVKAIKRGGKTPAKPAKTTYQSKLDQQGEIAKASLAAKLGSLSFGNLTVPRSQSGKVQVGTPELPGDAELLAQYAASRLDKLNTVADLNAEMVKEFGAEVEPHLPIIRQRAYQIRHEARLAELEVKDTEAPRRRTILTEIQKEISNARQIVQEQARQAEAANKAAKVEAAKEQKAQARQEAKTAREQERSKREAIAKDARQRLKDAKREYQEATKAETQGYRETIKAGREAARVAKLWDTPIRNESQAARERMSTNDPKSPATMDDLVSIAAEKMLPKTPGGIVRKGVISPAQLYSEMRNEFPSLITKKNKGEIYKRAYQRIEDMTTAAREAARLRSASVEAQKVWTEQGMDIDAQGILIQKAEVIRKQSEIRKQMVGEFNRVSRSKIGKIIHEAEAIPRALQTTLNMHQGRQGLYAILTHPISVTAKVGIPATLKGYSALTRPQYIQRVRELQEHPYYKLGEKAGLNLAELPGTVENAKLAVEEDELQSTVAMNLPHVRLSNQGFALGMNSERVQLFAVYAAIGEAEGYTWESNPDFFKEIASIANDATGRGTMPKAIQGMARLTNHVFYATRLNVSRVKLLNDLFNPWQYHNYDPVTRKIMAKEAIKILLALGAIFYAAHRLGLHVEHDPNKPDTGKVVWGHTHYDLTGGIGTDVRFAYRMVRGIAKELVGQKLPENEKPLALGIRFGRQKLAPWPGAVWDYLEGKNAVGEPANLKVDTHEKAKTLKENILLRMLVPIVADDFANGFVDGGWLGMAKESPVVIGFGAQTYPPRHEKPEALTPKEPTVPVAVKDKVDKEFKRLDIKTGTVQGSIDVLTELEQKDAVRKIMESEKVDRKAATELLREKNLLPQDELDKFNQSYQENLYRLANQLITNDQFYSRLKDFEKEDRLDRVKKIAHTIARREIKTELKTK